MIAKHINFTSDVYYMNLFPRRNENRKLDNRFEELTGTCTTRIATKEELNKHNNNKLKEVDNYEEVLYNIIYGETLSQNT